MGPDSRTVEAMIDQVFDGWTEDDARPSRRVADDVHESDFARRLVGLARAALNLDAMWISEFTDDEQILAVVDSVGSFTALKEGSAVPLDGSICGLVSCEGAPNVIPDTRSHPATRHLEISYQFGFQGYVGAPIRAGDGNTVGMLCGISAEERDSRPEDLQIIRLFADMMSGYRRQLEVAAGDRSRAASEFQRHFSTDLSIVFQPIVELSTGEITSAEALSRFAKAPLSPIQRFENADLLGRGIDAEAISARRALALLPRLPDAVAISVNASPAFIRSGLAEVIAMVDDPGRVTVEVTEHHADHDPQTLRKRLDFVRSWGCRIAIDDVGTGYSGLQRMIELRPDIVKLDRVLVDGCDADPLKQAVIGATVQVCSQAGVKTVAEGIEQVADARTLIGLGVDCGQGFLLARPEPLPLPLACPLPAA